MASEVVTMVRKVTRRTSSKSGNPKKVLHTDDGLFVTATDAMCAYGISDHWSEQAVRLTLDGRGQVVEVEEINGRGAVHNAP